MARVAVLDRCRRPSTPWLARSSARGMCMRHLGRPRRLAAGMLRPPGLRHSARPALERRGLSRRPSRPPRGRAPLRIGWRANGRPLCLVTGGLGTIRELEHLGHLRGVGPAWGYRPGHFEPLSGSSRGGSAAPRPGKLVETPAPPAALPAAACIDDPTLPDRADGRQRLPVASTPSPVPHANATSNLRARQARAS